MISDLSLLEKGFLIGLSIAAPVGPIGLLCIQRALRRGFASGLCTGLGAATADGIYGAIAAFGVTLVSRVLLQDHAWIQLLGGIVLTYLGLRIFRSPPVTDAAPAREDGPLLLQYLTTVFLTLANPLTILFFVAVFASFGIAGSSHVGMSAALTVLGVFIGSAVWWLGLAFGVSSLRQKLPGSMLGRLNQVAGLAIIVFGVFSVASSHIL